MKTQFLTFLHQLSLFDYLLFGGIVFFFFLFLFLAILFHHKLKLAVTLILLAFVLLTAGPPIGYMTLHYYLHKHTVQLTTVQDLQFTDAIVIKGDLNNTSKYPIKECALFVGVSKKTSYPFINRFYPYVPFRHKTIYLHQTIKPGESQTFKILIEPFRYSKPHTVTVRGHCK